MVPSSRFEQIVSLVAQRPGQLKPELLQLLSAVHDSLLSVQPGPGQLCNEMHALLTFMDREASQGCLHFALVSDFFLVENEWEMDWSYLPDEMEELMFDLSRAHTDEPDFNPDTAARLKDRLECFLHSQAAGPLASPVPA